MFKITGTVIVGGVIMYGVGKVFNYFNRTPFGGSVKYVKLSGNTIIINGIQYKSVSKITIETTTEKIKLEEKYVDLAITIQGDIQQPMTLSNSKVIVNGNCNGDVSISNGKIKVEGSVYGNASTSNGNIDIKGICNGTTKTSNGKVRK